MTVPNTGEISLGKIRQELESTSTSNDYNEGPYTGSTSLSGSETGVYDTINSGSVDRSSPSNSIFFALTVAVFLGSNRIIESAVTDFPQPDSPTMERNSPLCTLKLVLSTALTIPAPVENSTSKSSTSNRTSGLLLLSLFIYKDQTQLLLENTL